mmetsp:Transcript_89033/g.240664  ORF Transcript_89033/g.240664 Transcript_89033/m.240664 type:complete len:258 (-) Transcript_89033:65-838(-)
MVAASRTRAAGHAALAASGAVWLLSASAFVAPQGPSGARDAGLRSHRLEISPFQAALEQQEPLAAMSWTSLVSVMAAFGLAAGIATMPVRAEEAAAPATESAVPVAAPVKSGPSNEDQTRSDEAKRAGAPGKAERLRASLEAIAKVDQSNIGGKINEKPSSAPVTSRKVKKESILNFEKQEKKAAKASASTATSSMAAPPVGQLIAYKNKVIISPSDMLDEDELSLARTNMPLLALIFATPISIFLFFYVFGSLNII